MLNRPAGYVGKKLFGKSGKRVGNAAYLAATRQAVGGARIGMPGYTKMPMATRAATGNKARTAAMTNYYQKMGRRTMIGGAVGAASISTAMRPNANQHRGGYRGPMMSAPPGSGRFA